MRTKMSALLVLLLCSVSGCTSSDGPLRAYLKQYGYQAFNPPRNRDGVGTIIDFKSGAESVVATPDPPESQCLTMQQVPRGDDIAVAVLTRDYTITNNSTIDLNVAKGAIKEAELSAAFSDQRVKTIKVQLIEPYESRLTHAAVAAYVATMKNDDPCRKYLADPSNFVIQRVLGAKGIRYTFNDKNDVSIKIDATILSLIGLKGSTASQFDGKNGMEFNKPILIGYRLWKATEAPGIAGAPLILRDATVSEIATARQHSLNQ